MEIDFSRSEPGKVKFKMDDYVEGVLDGVPEEMHTFHQHVRR